MVTKSCFTETRPSLALTLMFSKIPGMSHHLSSKNGLLKPFFSQSMPAHVPRTNEVAKKYQVIKTLSPDVREFMYAMICELGI